jgi:transposase-like protein
MVRQNASFCLAWSIGSTRVLNNRAENSHQSTRLREKKMRKFKSAKQAQRFLSADHAYFGTFLTKTTFVECRGIPRYFAKQLPDLKRGSPE